METAIAGTVAQPRLNATVAVVLAAFGVYWLGR
jgi:uncharacterized membrane protein